MHCKKESYKIDMQNFMALPQNNNGKKTNFLISIFKYYFRNQSGSKYF